MICRWANEKFSLLFNYTLCNPVFQDETYRNISSIADCSRCGVTRNGALGTKNEVWIS